MAPTKGARQARARGAGRASLAAALAVAGGLLWSRQSSAFSPAVPHEGRAELPRRSGLQGLGAALGLSAALPAEAAAKRPALGSNFEVSYDGVPSDITFGGGKGPLLLPQFTVRVLSVEPGGPSEAAGVQPGDEVVNVASITAEDKKQSVGSNAINMGAFLPEERIATKQDPDSAIRTFLNDQGGGRCQFRFRAKSTLNIGDKVPDFKLISTTGGEVSLSDYTSRGKPVVVFFRPGFRFYGDKFEVQAFSRASPILKDLGVNVVGITSDPIQAQAKSAKATNAPFLLLQDTDSEVAAKYGATLATDYNVVSSAPATDRKTFIVGPDGKLLKVYSAVGWELNKASAINHIIEVCDALGADPEQVREALNPKQRSIGEFLQYANGVPAERKEKLQTNEVPFDPFKGGFAGLR